MPKHILIIDDDALLRRSLAFNLEKSGYRTSNAATAEDGITIALRDQPNLVLLDIGLPEMDGMDAIRYFKDKLGVPVIFVTARRRELDEVVGLELGADDYVTKPFDLDVLLARIKAVMRRTESTQIPKIPGKPITVGDLSLDPAAHTTILKGKQIDLSPREFDLLHTFLAQPNTVISVDDLLRHVWGPDFFGQPQVVYVHIRWLREKIEENPNQPKRIITIRNVGYKYESQES